MYMYICSVPTSLLLYDLRVTGLILAAVVTTGEELVEEGVGVNTDSPLVGGAIEEGGGTNEDEVTSFLKLSSGILSIGVST